MNLITHIVVGEDQNQTIEFTWIFYMKYISGFIYLKEIECDNNKIVQINF